MKDTPTNLAIIGYGAAGKAREKAFTHISNAKLSAIVSRQNQFSTHSLEEILNDKNIHGVCISTENTRHFELIKTCLEHRKHVLCDYPLAFSHEDLQILIHLAQSNELILHAEHIGLLMKDHIEIKKKILSFKELKGGEYKFIGNWNQKLFNPSYTGPHQFLAYSRLIQICDLFGDFKIDRYNFNISEKTFFLECNLKFDNDSRIMFIERRSPGLKRKREFKVKMDDQEIYWTPRPEKGLFERDLYLFVNSIENPTYCNHYISWKTILGVTSQLEKIQPKK